MQRTLFGLAAVTALILAGIAVAGEEGVKWFDMENCDMCKPLMAVEGLVDHVHWESYPIANGILSVTTVPDNYREGYEKASQEMQTGWERLQAGEEMHLCGMCQAWVALWDESISWEKVKTKRGEVSITTSTNPETVAKLHEIAERNAKEMAAMSAEGAPEKKEPKAETE
jgi:hypothetical protein